MIGLSLSKCVAAICRRKVKITQVKKIIARTMVFNVYGWDQIIAGYQARVWSEFPEEAEKVARHFIDNGLVEQPLLSEARRYPDISKGIWVRSEKDIKWISGAS